MVCALADTSGLATPFTLIPFPGVPPQGARVSGSLARKGGDLLCRFQVEGLAGLEIPDASEEPRRRHELWRETCLEIFLGRPGQGSYREVNLSPAGHWNVYRFTDYREGMEEEAALAFLPFLVLPEPEPEGESESGPARLTLDVALDLGALGLAEGEIEVGLSAVLLSKGGETAYHALAHPRVGEEQGKADFHHRRGWTLKLPPENLP
jgi:hypothetical protein